jgi:hypothetical protein
MTARSPYDFWLDLAYYLAGNDEFAAGFWAAVLLIGVFYLVTGPLYAVVSAAWKRFRQAFSPTTKPAKVPTEQGPSPARSCLGALLAAALFVILVVAVFVYLYCSVLGGVCT